MAHAAVRVLTDEGLLRRVASFQHGLPLVLYAFWGTHDASIASTPRNPNLIHEKHGQLLSLIVQHGDSTRLLDMFKSVQFADYDHQGFHWTSPSLERVVEEAVVHDRLDVLEWAIANGAVGDDPVSVWTNVLTCRPVRENGHVVDEFSAAVAIQDDALQQLILDEQREIQAVSVLKSISETKPRIMLPPEMMTWAAMRGDLAMVRYLCECRPSDGCHAVAFEIALRNNQYAVLEYLFRNRPGVLTWTTALTLLDEYDETAKELLRRFVPVFPPIPFHIVRSAVTRGITYRLRRFLEMGLLSPVCIDAAVTSDELDGIQWLQEHELATATTNAVDRAAANGHWGVVGHLLKTRTEGFSLRALYAAVSTGQIDHVQLLINHCSMIKDPGSLDAVKLQLIDLATASGHTEILQCLHESVLQSKDEHMDLLLDEEPSEAFAPLSRSDERNGIYLKCVASPPVTQLEAMRELLLSGETEAFMKVREALPDDANTAVNDVAAVIGERLQLRTIRLIIHELGRSDLSETILEGASKTAYRNTSDAAWLRAVHAVTGPSSCGLVVIQSAIARTAVCSLEVLNPIKFLISVCKDHDAKHFAAASARTHGMPKLAEKLESWDGSLDTTLTSELHPLLEHPNARSWVIEKVLSNRVCDLDPYKRSASPLSWAIQAVYHNDVMLLRALREMSAHPKTAGDPMYSFAGARHAAIRENNLPILQWLLENVDTPVEPTLLDEALYYHHYDTAEWIVINCPTACGQLDWLSKPRWWSLTDCGLSRDLLNWIFRTESVRSKLCFAGIVDYAVAIDDAASLRTLYAHIPGIIHKRPRLIQLARQNRSSATLEFLQEIKYGISRR